MNKHQQAMPTVHDYQSQQMNNNKTDTKASSEFGPGLKQSVYQSEQAVQRQIKFSRFKCRDLNGQNDNQNYGYGKQN